MMEIKIVTNNPWVHEQAAQENMACEYYPSDAQSILLYARDLLCQGWQLAADPLAGYNTRFNPYHSVFLEQGEAKLTQQKGEEMQRLERAARHLDHPRRPAAEKTDSIRRDYQQLDLALASNTMLRLQSLRAHSA